MANYIEISNVGPIKNVKINLKKINIFIGEQSSGKSTIAKIISHCNWVEKDVSLQQSLNDYKNDKELFVKRLESFHKMKGYFNKESEIIFRSNTINIHYKRGLFQISWREGRFLYKRKKTSYIPAERTTAILPEIEKIELPNSYLKSFLFDWFDARKNHFEKNHMPLLDIGVDYYYSESSKENHVLSNDNSYDISLSQASSGLQSITPLIVLINHLTNRIYSEKNNTSYEFDKVKESAIHILFSELIIKSAEKDEKWFSEVQENLFNMQGVNLIIEEPESNLFPSTQKKLIYYLLQNIINNPEHNLTLTTHSQYVLYSINNCIMASLVQEKLSDKETEKLPCLESKLSPKNISIYQVENGTVKCIQQDDGSSGENFFDDKMKELMDEFYIMLNHYE